MSAAPSLEAGHATSIVKAASAVAGQGLREMFRSPQVLATTLGQGVVFLLVFRYVFGGAISTAQASYVEHLAPGVITAGIVFAATGASVAAAQDRTAGLTDLLATQPAPRLSLVMGRVLADTAVVYLAAIVLAAAAVGVGFRPAATFGQLLAAAAMAALYAAAYVALFGALGALASGPQAAQGLGFLAIPMSFVSSAFVPVDTMPTWLAWFAERQPITVQIEALRALVHPVEAGVSTVPGILASVGILAVGVLVRLRAEAPQRGRPNHGSGG